jgi:hypothetical protein
VYDTVLTVLMQKVVCSANLTIITDSVIYRASAANTGNFIENLTNIRY